MQALTIGKRRSIVIGVVMRMARVMLEASLRPLLTVKHAVTRKLGCVHSWAKIVLICWVFLSVWEAADASELRYH